MIWLIVYVFGMLVAAGIFYEEKLWSKKTHPEGDWGFSLFACLVWPLFLGSFGVCTLLDSKHILRVLRVVGLTLCLPGRIPYMLVRRLRTRKPKTELPIAILHERKPVMIKVRKGSIEYSDGI